MQLTISVIVSSSPGRSGGHKSGPSSWGELRLEIANNRVVISPAVDVAGTCYHSSSQVDTASLRGEHHLLRLSFLAFNLKVRFLYKVFKKVCSRSNYVLKLNHNARNCYGTSSKESQGKESIKNLLVCYL